MDDQQRYQKELLQNLKKRSSDFFRRDQSDYLRLVEIAKERFGRPFQTLAEFTSETESRDIK
jgi:hypothetical protein